MFQNHHFEKVSSADICVQRKNPRVSTLWRMREGNGNKFAFVFIAILLLGGVGQAAAEGTKPPLDLNQATSVELEALPGIGAVKAAAILAVRDAQGGFSSLEQLESVRGIGPALVTKLRPLVSLGKPVAGSRATSAKASAKPKVRSGSAGRTSAAVPGRSAQPTP